MTTEREVYSAYDDVGDPFERLVGSLANRPGDYDAMVEHLGALASGATKDLKELITACTFPSEEDRIYVQRLIEIGEYQLNSEAARRRMYMRDARIRCDRLREALREWDDLSREELADLPPSVEHANIEIENLERLLVRWQRAENEAMRNGSKYDATPLFEFLERSEKDRRGMSYTRWLPPELQQAESLLQFYVSVESARYIHQESMGAKMLPASAMKGMDVDQYSKLVSASRGGYRRSPGYQE